VFRRRPSETISRPEPVAVAGDVPDAVELIVRVLSAAGHDIERPESLAEVEQFAGSQSGVLVLDLHHSSTVQAWQERLGQPKVPRLVLVLSPAISPTDVESFGPATILRRPVHVRTLVRAVGNTDSAGPGSAAHEDGSP
jgi:hypothetical protein